MKCNQVQEMLPDLAAGMGSGMPEVEAHLASCAACTAKFEELHQTMALLDEWQVPEPSPYFDTRVRARVREEMARPASRWRHWIRRPVLAFSMMLAFLSGLTLVLGRPYMLQTESINTKPPEITAPVEPGTAVGDLEALEKNHELYADFDILDELQVQDEETADR